MNAVKANKFFTFEKKIEKKVDLILTRFKVNKRLFLDR